MALFEGLETPYTVSLEKAIPTLHLIVTLCRRLTGTWRCSLHSTIQSLLLAAQELDCHTKTRVFDDSVLIDCVWLPFPLLKILKRGGIWLRETGLVPYAWRHSVPLIDIINGHRSLLDNQTGEGGNSSGVSYDRRKGGGRSSRSRHSAGVRRVVVEVEVEGVDGGEVGGMGGSYVHSSHRCSRNTMRVSCHPESGERRQTSTNTRRLCHVFVVVFRRCGKNQRCCGMYVSRPSCSPAHSSLVPCIFHFVSSSRLARSALPSLSSPTHVYRTLEGEDVGSACVRSANRSDSRKRHEEEQCHPESRVPQTEPLPPRELLSEEPLQFMHAGRTDLGGFIWLVLESTLSSCLSRDTLIPLCATDCWLTSNLPIRSQSMFEFL